MRHFLAAALLALASCGETYRAEVACRAEAGVEPDRGADVLGVLGAVAKMSDPAWQAWNRSVAACVDREEAAR